MTNNDIEAERETNIFVLMSELTNMSGNQDNNLATDSCVKLFSLLALLKAYNPASYLLMSECQKILGPPDPIHGGPPFEDRMEPFMSFIDMSELSSGHVCLTDQKCAQVALELLSENLLAKRSTIMEMLFSVCGDQPQPDIIQFIKELLTKRETGEHGKKEKFSRLIEDIQEKEGFTKAVSVLKTASDKFRQDPFFPQTISRLYYITGGRTESFIAEQWAREAIRRAPNNSYMADTLGQIYKKRLMREAWQQEILNRAKEALRAFEDVERKADQEVGPEMMDTAGAANMSHTFNNRGCFGFIQVAKIVFDKLRKYPSQEHNSFIQTLQMKVEAKFDFFEWYLTYSEESMSVFEPDYFWRDIVLCYQYYTAKSAAESTSFPGLLDCLNHSLFMSKGIRAGFEETEPDLEAIQDHLKTAYEANVDDVKIAERYILSNIILSNKLQNSPQLTSVQELQVIMHRFLGTEIGWRSSEFYLLLLLLFWPEEQPQVVQEVDDEGAEQQATEDEKSEDKTWEDEEQVVQEVDDEGAEQQATEDEKSEDKTWEDEEQVVQEVDDEGAEQQATEDEKSEDKTWEDEEQETRGEPAQPPPDLIFIPDLQQHVTFMKRSFDRAKYGKYLRGRYLLPLFFLGKGSGLSKWIHKSRLDAIVEEKVDAEFADYQGDKKKQKCLLIKEMWVERKVWQVPEIQDILLPVQVEPCQPPMMQQMEGEEYNVFVCAGGKKIEATTKDKPDASAPYYLGFTIQGPVLF